VDNVLRVDARPHHDAHLREFGAHLAELFRQVALRRIEFGRPIEQRGALRVELGELVPTVRDAAITHRVFDAGHGGFPSRLSCRGKLPATVTNGCASSGRAPRRSRRAPVSNRLVSAILAKNRCDRVVGWRVVRREPGRLRNGAASAAQVRGGQDGGESSGGGSVGHEGAVGGSASGPAGPGCVTSNGGR
jgi:hypothetical protein